MKITKISLLMMLMWLSLTSMTTLNSCAANKRHVGSTTTDQPVTNPQGAPAGGDVVLGAARTSRAVKSYWVPHAPINMSPCSRENAWRC